MGPATGQRSTDRKSALAHERYKTALEQLEKRGQHVLYNTKGISNKFGGFCWCGCYHRIVMAYNLPAEYKVALPADQLMVAKMAS